MSVHPQKLGLWAPLADNADERQFANRQ